MGLFAWFSKLLGDYSDDTENAWYSSDHQIRPSHFIGRDFIVMRPWHQAQATPNDEWLEHSNSSGLFDDHDIVSEHSIASPIASESHINPMMELSMAEEVADIDVIGNANGVGMSQDDSFTSPFDDPFTSPLNDSSSSLFNADIDERF